MDQREITGQEKKVPAGSRNLLLSKIVQTGCGAHTASYSTGTGAPSHGRGVKITTNLRPVA
jgi:hypothetical protein